MGREEGWGRRRGGEGREEGPNDGLRFVVLGRSIDDHDHLETGVGTKARFGGCMGGGGGLGQVKREAANTNLDEL